MSARTTQALVVSILGPGPRKYQYDGSTPLDPFIVAASVFIDQAIPMAIVRGYSVVDGPDDSVNPTMWGIVERYFAAHLYQVMDQGYQSRSTQGASGSFTGQTGKKLESTYYGQQALLLDVTGTLEILDKRKIAGLTWGGKPVSQQIPYDQRN